MSSFLFAFGPDGTDSYYISNRVFHTWNNLPPGLQDRLRQPQYAADKVESIAIFPDGGFFITGAGRKGVYAYERLPTPIQTAINSLPGGASSVAGIEFDGANPESYIIAVKPSLRLEHRSLPRQLLNEVLRFAFSGFEEICLGYAGSYNLITNHCLSVGKMAGRYSLQAVTLSPYHPGHYFAVFKDGSIEYDLPILWRPAIEKLTGKNCAPRTPPLATRSLPLFSDPPFTPMPTQNPTPPYTPETPSTSYAQGLQAVIHSASSANQYNSLGCGHPPNDDTRVTRPTQEHYGLQQPYNPSNSNGLYATCRRERADVTIECPVQQPSSNDAGGNFDPAIVWEMLLDTPEGGIIATPAGGRGVLGCSPEIPTTTTGQIPMLGGEGADHGGDAMAGGSYYLNQNTGGSGAWFDFSIPASMGSGSMDFNHSDLPLSSTVVNFSDGAESYVDGLFALMNNAEFFSPVDVQALVDMDVGCVGANLSQRWLQ